MDAEPSVAVRALADSDGALLTGTLSLWDAGLQLVSNARRVARSPLAELFSNGVPRRELYFVRENAALQFYDSFLDATNILDRTAYTEFVNIRVCLIVAFVIVTVLLMVLALVVFRPTVVRVQREKAEALRLFRDIPRAVVLELSRAGEGYGEGSEDSESSGYDSFEDLDPDAHGRQTRRRSSGFSGNRRSSVASATGRRRRQSRAGVDEAAAPPRRNSILRAIGGPATAPLRAFSARFARWTLIRARLAHAARSLRQRFHAPDRVTVLYAGAFGVLWVLFLVWFALGLQNCGAYEAFGTERNFAGQLRSLALRVEYHAVQMAVDAADFARQRSLLEAAAATLAARERSLLFGNVSEHLFGSLNRYRPTDQLLFSSTCFATAEACALGAPVYREGLHALLGRYVEEALLAARLPQAKATPADPHIRFLSGANTAGLQPGLARLADLYFEEGQARLESFKSIQAACFASLLALILLEYLFVFRRIIANLSDESRRTAFMFLMLPPEVIEATESIKTHLARLMAAIARADGP
eukprot:tig00000605_g2492.t1